MEKKIERFVVGRVEAVSSINTVKVSIESLQKHPKYGKFVLRQYSYLVDTNGFASLEAGQLVKIAETRPISKKKFWNVIGLVN
jgi:small subunit ribosomal protein S17